MTFVKNNGDNQYSTDWYNKDNLPSFSYSNHSFLGWYYSNGNYAGAANSEYKPSGNTTLYGHWGSTVSFNGNNGSGHSDIVIDNNSSTTYTKLPDSTRTNYKFLGWYTSATNGEPKGTYNEDFYPNGNITLYAHWGSTVSFNGNGETIDIDPVTVDSNSSKNYVTLQQVTRTDYGFAGWFDAAKDGDNKGKNCNFTPSGHTTLYAHWSSTVSYDGNDITISKNSETVDSNSSKNYVTLTKEERAGYGFAGWSESKNGSCLNSTTYTPIGNKTLYAHWSSTVTFDGNGVDIDVKPITVDSNSSSKSVKMPLLNIDNHVFIGWSTDSSGTDTIYKANTYYTPSGNTKLYAIWFEITNNMIFGSDGLIYEYYDDQLTIYNIDADGKIQSLNKGILIDNENKKHDLSNLGSCTIEDNITEICSDAFLGCIDLISLSLSADVEIIGDRAFYGSSINKVTLPENIKTIGANAFSDCDSLTSLGVSTKNANYSTSGGVLFNKDKTKLIQYPIGKTTSTYVIPKTVTSIETGAFINATKLKSISVESTNTSFKSIDGVLYSYDGKTLVAYPSGKTSSTFTVPSTVGNIMYGALSGCTNIKSFIVADNNENYKSISGVIYSSDGKTLVAYPGSNEENYIIPGTVVNIAPYAFAYAKFTTVSIPQSVETISNFAFYSCENLDSVVLGVRLTNVGNYAFVKCTCLNSIDTTCVHNIDVTPCFDVLYSPGSEICSSVSNQRFIKSYGKLISVPKITISDVNNTEADKKDASNFTGYAYYNYGESGYTLVFYGKGPMKYTNSNFSDKIPDDIINNTKELVVTEGITALGNYLFGQFTSLEKITFAPTVVNYGNGAFAGNNLSKLTYLELPKANTDLGYNVSNSFESGYVYEKGSDGQMHPAMSGIFATTSISGNDIHYSKYIITGTGFYNEGTIIDISLILLDGTYSFEGWYLNDTFLSKSYALKMVVTDEPRVIECRIIQKKCIVEYTGPKTDSSVTITGPTMIGASDKWSFDIELEKDYVYYQDGSALKLSVTLERDGNAPLTLTTSPVTGTNRYHFIVENTVSSDCTVKINTVINKLVEYVTADSNEGGMISISNDIYTTQNRYNVGSDVIITLTMSE